MPATVTELTEQALGLSESERAEMAHRLLLSLEEVVEEGVEEAWGADVARRLERVRQGTAHCRPAEEVFRDIRAQHQK